MGVKVQRLDRNYLLSMSRHFPPADLLPFPFDTERRSHFLIRWGRSSPVKKLYPGGAVISAGMERWEEAKRQSEVSIKTFEDQFLVFGDS